MMKLAKTVTKMCILYLGLEAEITWCSDAEEEFAAELMQYILHSGNFGCKKNRNSQRTKAALRNYCTNPVRLFRNLTQAGMSHLQEAGKKPRKAYAWLYQLVRLSILFLRMLSGIRLSDTAKENAEEIRFLKKLGVTRL